MLSQKDEELEKSKGRSVANGSSPQQQPTTGRSRTDESDLSPSHSSTQLAIPDPNYPMTAQQQTLNTDYIKNVFIKYLEYLANSNEKEAMTLEKVLFTVL
jgi:hypothetical protein